MIEPNDTPMESMSDMPNKKTQLIGGSIKCRPVDLKNKPYYWVVPCLIFPDWRLAAIFFPPSHLAWVFLSVILRGSHIELRPRLSSVG
jgi:hypothetical protein